MSSKVVIDFLKTFSFSVKLFWSSLTPFEAKWRWCQKLLNSAHQFKCRFQDVHILGSINIGFGSSEQTFVDQSHELALAVLLEIWNPDISSSTPTQPPKQHQLICPKEISMLDTISSENFISRNFDYNFRSYLEYLHCATFSPRCFSLRDDGWSGQKVGDLKLLEKTTGFKPSINKSHCAGQWHERYAKRRPIADALLKNNSLQWGGR